jgi:DNA (cytosine-5)-methyltransferase 1
VSIKAIDLCCGAGGWACAARGFPIEIVAAIDLWEPATTTYRLNFPDCQVIHGDVRNANLQKQVLAIAKAAGVSLVLGGIPCEWLSVYRVLSAVKEDEIADQRETMDAVLGLVESIDPKWSCLEDVVGIIKHLPLMTQYHILDARHWSCQRRRRCFIGHFPIPPRENNSDTAAVALRRGPFRIGKRLWGRTPQRHRTFTNSTCLALDLDRKAATSRRDAELGVVDPAVPGGLRNLEWQEAAAIQGFPDDFIFYGSPTDVSAMVGRAVPIPLARAILKAICLKEAEAGERKLAEAIA